MPEINENDDYYQQLEGTFNLLLILKKSFRMSPLRYISYIIFIILVALVALMLFTGSTVIIWLGFTLLPFLVILQTYIILKREKKDDRELGDEWFEKN